MCTQSALCTPHQKESYKMQPVAYTPSRLNIFDGFLVILTGTKEKFRGDTCIEVYTTKGGRILIPEKHAQKLRPLSDLIGNDQKVEEVLTILRGPQPKRQAILARKNVLQKELATIVISQQDVLSWAKILADIYHRNKNRRINSQASSESIVFTNVYDAILEIFLLTFAAYWQVEQKAAAKTLERRMERSFTLGTV